MTNKAKITWPDGSVEEANTPHDRAGLINEMWGSAFDDFIERGGELTVEAAEDPLLGPTAEELAELEATERAGAAAEEAARVEAEAKAAEEAAKAATGN